MFAKIWTSLAILLAVSLEVRGHAAIAPALGLGSTAPVRNDVKRPSTASPCGAGVNVASALGKSTPVQAAADGTFTATITNFNGGKDGSRQVTAQVDAAATGKGANFVAMTVSQNGDAAPATTGSQPIVASIPAGTTCSGGTSGDLCLVSFKTLGGFGNCVAVQQSGGAASGTAGNSTDTATGTAGNSTATDTAAGSASNSTTTGTAGAADASGSAAATATGTGSTGVAGAAGGATGATTKGAGKGNGNGNGKVNKGNVAQAGGNANAGAAAGTTHKGNGKAAGAGAGAVAGGAAASGSQPNVQGNQDLAKGKLAQGGTRAARALLADLEERGGEIVNDVRRGIASWAWA